MHNKFLFKSVLITSSLLLYTAIANAQDKINEVKSDLKLTIQELESVSQKDAEIEQKKAGLQTELRDLQKELVKSAARVQEQEKTLSSLEIDLSTLKAQELQISEHLKQQQDNLSSILQSMIKLSQVPPEMVIAMPGDFTNTLRTAKVLGITSSTLANEAREIRRQLVEIQKLRDAIEQKYAAQQQQMQKIEEERRALATKLDERSRLQTKMTREQERYRKKVRLLSGKSEDLRSLMQQLESYYKKEEKKKTGPLTDYMREQRSSRKQRQMGDLNTQIDTPSDKNKMQNTQTGRDKGRISLPVEGKISSFYGDRIGEDSKGQGIILKTRDHAQVVTPLGGVIVYTGTFRNYGKMVIIRHTGDTHSLLAGMERITGTMGQTVIRGEPIGEMGKGEDGTSLYMEFRSHNQPVDPLKALANTR